MKVKRFFAMSSREALKMVRMELGDDAVIISNRMVGEGNEILAVRGDDIDSMVTRDALKDAVHQIDPINAKNTAIEVNLEEAHSTLDNSQMAVVMKELRQMRDSFENRFNELSWRETQRQEPAKAEVLKMLLSVGFGASLSRYIAENLPPKLDESNALRWAKSALFNNLKTMTDESDMFDGGGVFSLIGPTGVGKTTTIAKIAARYVMKHGTGKLALITTDAYRIGGHDQLRSYGKILGVMVHAVKDEADLRLALEAFKDKHTILIDTAGVSQRNKMVDEQSDMFIYVNSDIKKVLCLNAASHIETLAEVVGAYGKTGLHGCIITKVDEAVSVGGVLDVIIKEKIKVYYMTNGQRVPDDIHVLNKKWLMQRTFDTGGHLSASPIEDGELPFMMASQIYRGANLELSHV